MNAPLGFIHEVENAIAHSSSERRVVMARRLTDLFLVGADKYSDDEIDLIDDVFVRLALVIEESARAFLAMRLAPMSMAPPKILRALACDDAIEVASPVLIQSERLDDLTLIECARTKSQEHLLAISRRKTLGEAVTDVLVERGDHQVVFSTAQNAGAKFSNKGFTILIKHSKADERLATTVGCRPDISPQLFEQLLEAASESVRAKLEAESPHAKRDIHHAVTDVTARIRAQATVQSTDYAAAQVLIDSLNQAGQLTAAKLEYFAKSDRFEETVVALAVMSGIPTDVVERRLKDEYVEFLLILAKAIDLSWVTTRIIINLGARNHRCSTKGMEQYLIDFNSLKRETARTVLSYLQKPERYKPE